LERHKERGLPLAFAIAGHHAGLADYITAEPGFPKPLKERLKENVALMQSLSPLFPPKIATHPIPAFPEFLSSPRNSERIEKGAQARQMEFWIRFLFSALVDADRLDSEEFCQPEKSSKRGFFPSVKTLSKRIDSHIDAIQASLPASVKESPVSNTLRMRVVKQRRTRKVHSLLPCRREEERLSRRCLLRFTTRTSTTCGV
jgi:hypothetical protein